MNKLEHLGDVLADIAVSLEVLRDHVLIFDDLDLRGLPKNVQSAVEVVRHRLADLCLEEVFERVDDTLAMIDAGEC